MYFLARYYPFIALGALVIFGELAWIFHRKRQGARWIFMALCLFFFVTGILWLVFRGDLYSDQWVRELIG